MTINSERRVRAPYGLQGGESGTKGVNTIQRADGLQEIVSAKYTTQVSEGDKVKIETPGGGGYCKYGKRRNS
jgi:N-methylhydantoinase B/oxoprolinase/acetone carboxylase alpha subunit